jgi:hypothetical protein
MKQFELCRSDGDNIDVFYTREEALACAAELFFVPRTWLHESEQSLEREGSCTRLYATATDRNNNERALLLYECDADEGPKLHRAAS